MRLHRSSLVRTLVTLVTSACIGGTGSGLIGVSGDGNGGGTTGQARVLQFFAQPGNANAGEVLPPVMVLARDSLGNVDTLFRAQVTVALQSTAGGAGALNGTSNAAAVRGVATFGNLRVDQPGTYRLRATSSGATATTSDPFTITTLATP